MMFTQGAVCSLALLLNLPRMPFSRSLMLSAFCSASAGFFSRNLSRLAEGTPFRTDTSQSVSRLPVSTRFSFSSSSSLKLTLFSSLKLQSVASFLSEQRLLASKFCSRLISTTSLGRMSGQLLLESELFLRWWWAGVRVAKGWGCGTSCCLSCSLSLSTSALRAFFSFSWLARMVESSESTCCMNRATFFLHSRQSCLQSTASSLSSCRCEASCSRLLSLLISLNNQQLYNHHQPYLTSYIVLSPQDARNHSPMPLSRWLSGYCRVAFCWKWMGFDDSMAVDLSTLQYKMIVYGIISYLLLGGLIGGYFAVKKWGDKQQPAENQPGYSQFEDEQNGKKTIST